jgi:hypothetical protein
VKKLQQFAIGQRWLSDTETELGLGVVIDVDERSSAFYFQKVTKHEYMHVAMHLYLELFLISMMKSTIRKVTCGWLSHWKNALA